MTPQNPSPNKQLILDFLEAVAQDPRAAFLKYAVPDYRQHNQTIGDGRECVIAAFSALGKMAGPGSYTLKHMLEEDDKVVLFAYLSDQDGKPVSVLVDMFRIENGKLVEHWDVAQRITDLPFRGGALL